MRTAKFGKVRVLLQPSLLAHVPQWPGSDGAQARAGPLPAHTTEGNGPRAPTFDASGLQAISINEASHIYHMPQHFLRDERPEFRDWLRARGLPALPRLPRLRPPPDSPSGPRSANRS